MKKTLWWMAVVAAILAFGLVGGCGDDGDNGGDGWAIVEDHFTDERDGQQYRMVKMPDGKWWMAENLNYDTADGTGSRCYNDDTANCSIYGRFYSWNTAMAGASSSDDPIIVRGVCPAGWHLPSDAEWTELEKSVGDSLTVGKKLKSKTGWNDGGNGTDNYGFSALPGGEYFPPPPTPPFGGIGNFGKWWSSSHQLLHGNTANKSIRTMDSEFDDVRRSAASTSYRFSVRCVKD